MKIQKSVWYDNSTKDGQRRHDCFRADIRQFEKRDGKWVQISRTRKRFKTKDDAKLWIGGAK